MKHETYFLPDKLLECLIFDFLVAGSETTFTTLRWALLYMAAYPDVQRKVHEELDSVIGPDRLPNMADKKNTPYTEAVLSEVQRVNTLIPFSVAHTNLTENFEVESYNIPPCTMVVGNLHAVHRDPEVWKNPVGFDPNNFLNDDGKLVNLDRLLPFGMGERFTFKSSVSKRLVTLSVGKGFVSYTVSASMYFSASKDRLRLHITRSLSVQYYQ